MRSTPSGEPEMTKLYLPYRKEGAYFSWASDFAKACPEVDFPAAERLAESARPPRTGRK
jgi:hypothetical protein